MKISILLPYKENFSSGKAGAVSLFVNDITSKSYYKKNTFIFGNTQSNNPLSKNYINLDLTNKFYQSKSKQYVKTFINYETKINSDLIEVHNRPNYISLIKKKLNKKIFLYFHNDPLSMNGSTSIKERYFILNTCSKIIFNSEWTKNRFFEDLDKFYLNSEKIDIIYQSTSKKKINFHKKEKIITFVGKLNKSKGYDLFGNAIIKILNEFKDWKSVVFGDEPREKINFYHERLINMGYQSNNNVLKTFSKSSIAVACSKWDEPFGRASLEASSRGCAVIISNKGGLPETITDGIILKKLNSISIYKEIKNLILNKKKLLKLQKNSLDNFYLDNRYSSSLIDNYRYKLFKNSINKNKKLKILHVTNFNVRHNGRLFYNTGRRINNGLLKLGHTVQTLSDRDTISQERKIMDIYGSKSLNQKLLNLVGNFTPDLIVIGHADQIYTETLHLIKKFYPSISISQWFLDKMDDKKWLNNKKRFISKLDYIDSSFCTTHPSSLNLKK